MSDETVLDVRAVAPHQRILLVFHRFEALKAGESFILVSDRDPHPHLLKLQAECCGLYDWLPIEAGPPVWRVEIVRCPGAAPRRKTIVAFMEAEHRRLRATYEAMQRAAADGDVAAANVRRSELDAALRRHVTLEERHLYPRMAEPLAESEASVLESLKAEHKELLQGLDEIATALHQLEFDRFFAASSRLWATLEVHDQREEDVVCRLADAVLAEGDALDVMRLMEMV